MPKEEGTGVEVGHAYVDLGLPSGLKWAMCNVGANVSTDFGDYFAWGEVEPKKDYSWDTYKYVKKDRLTKYNGRDNKTTLDPEDDAAYKYPSPTLNAYVPSTLPFSKLIT